MLSFLDLGERLAAVALVDHLQDPDDRPPDAHGHAEHRLGHVASL